MWLLSGPFDGEVGGDLGFQKTKLLKTGSSYLLGRKERALCVASKKISHDHCEFIVGKYTVDDVGDPSARSNLEFVNKKDKVMKIVRGDEQIAANPFMTIELQDGDVIAIVSGVTLTVKWETVCCYSPSARGKSTLSLETCASLGVNIIHTSNPQVTHHLTSSYLATPLIAASLLSACQFVKPEWMNEVIRLGAQPLNSDSSGGTSLEQSFTLPLTSKYRPSFSPALSPPQKVFKVWDPNEERLNMFAGLRFLWVGEKSRPLDMDHREVIERGQGSLDTFDVQTGNVKFHRALTRCQAKGKKLVVLGVEKSIHAAVGEDGWKELVAEAKSFGLHIVDPGQIVQAILAVDLTMFDIQSKSGVGIDEADMSSSLPDFVPNTHPEEPSIAPPEPEQKTRPPKRLTGRAVSHQPSQEATPISKTPEPEEAPRPRRALTRRVNAGVPVVTGIDDPSSILDSTPELSVAPLSQQPPVADLTAPTPVRPSKLKRRVVGGTASNTVESQVFSLGIDEFTEEPPLKKFKALFDASHPDRTGAKSLDESAFEDIQSDTYGSVSQTQTQTQAMGGRPLRSALNTNLSVLREEDEETQSGADSAPRGAKRPLQDDEDAEMEAIEEQVNANQESGSGPSLPKKRAIENQNAVEKASDPVPEPDDRRRAGGKPPSTATATRPSKAGAPAGKPDTDAAFLKAITSTKRGKKAEDAFDREFNKLKISKPDLGREEQEKEWAVLGDFGDETNIRGNFMVVVEMPLHRRDEDQRQRRNREATSEWHGKPNFKKFKKRSGVMQRSMVELVLSEENDYGMGPSYWKGGNTQAQSQGDFMATQEQTHVKSEAEVRQISKTNPIPDDNNPNDEIEPVPRMGRGKASSRAGSAVPQKRISTRKAKPPTNPRPLFLDSDEDIKEGVYEREIPNNEDGEQTLQSSAEPLNIKRRTTRAPPKIKKTAAILVDDDSDDGAVFTGFKGKRKRR